MITWPSCHKKCWHCRFLQTFLYIRTWICDRYIETLHFKFLSLRFNNAMVDAQLSLSTETAWIWLGKMFWLNIPFGLHNPYWKHNDAKYTMQVRQEMQWCLEKQPLFKAIVRNFCRLPVDNALLQLISRRHFHVHRVTLASCHTPCTQSKGPNILGWNVCRTDSAEVRADSKRTSASPVRKKA